MLIPKAVPNISMFSVTVARPTASSVTFFSLVAHFRLAAQLLQVVRDEEVEDERTGPVDGHREGGGGPELEDILCGAEVEDASISV